MLKRIENRKLDLTVSLENLGHQILRDNFIPPKKHIQTRNGESGVNLVDVIIG
jgi:hypothetical protein